MRPSEAGELHLFHTDAFDSVVRGDDVDAVDRFTNKREAWAERDVIVGFNPCVNVTATFTPTP